MMSAAAGEVESCEATYREEKNHAVVSALLNGLEPKPGTQPPSAFV